MDYTLFGGYIQSVTINTSYGIEGGSAQLSLVFPGDGPKATEDFENRFPKLGSPIGLRFGQCTYGGILQKFIHNKSLSGYTWDVIIQSPGKVFQGIQVILDAYDGTNFYGSFPSTNVFIGGSIKNIWNVFGVRENYFTGGIFGGSGVNSSGFPALDALNIIEEISRGEHRFGGPARFGDHDYTVDLSTLKSFVNRYYRLKGPIQSLGAVIEDCCSTFSQDFIPSIKPANSEILSNGVIENPVLTVLVNSKTFQPEPNRVKEIVKIYEQAGKLKSANFGKELVDGPTQKLVIGGPASRYEIVTKERFIPVWGFKTPQIVESIPTVESNFYVGTNYSPQSIAEIPILDNDVEEWCRRILPRQTESGTVWPAKVLEVRCAMSGFDTWAMYHILNKTLLAPYVYTYCDIQNEDSYGGAQFDQAAISAINRGDPAAYSLCGGKTKAGYISEEVKDILNKICSMISTAGNEFYGRKFLVLLAQEPGGIINNLKWIPEEYRLVNSWDVADSAWIEPAVYGPLRVEAYRDVSFYDAEGRLKAACEWSIKEDGLIKDFSSISDSYEIQGRTIASYNVQIDKTIYVSGLNMYALVTVPPVYVNDGYLTADKFMFQYMKILGLIQNPEYSYNALLNSGMNFSSVFAFPLVPAMDIPYAVGVPRQSNKVSWGAWWNKVPGDGGAEVIIEDSLRPEIYGSYDTLQDVAFSAYANIDNSGTGDSESGYIDILGLPEYNIAERMAGSGPYLTGIDVSVGIEGIETSYKFNTWTPQFGKLSKFNADRLASINRNATRFLQEQRQKFKKQELPSFNDIVKQIQESNINNLLAHNGLAGILPLLGGNDNG